MKERLNVLDSIRGIGACIIAFIWHYQHFTPLEGKPYENIISPLYRYGWLMVEIFFMISGFVMSYTYKEKIISNNIGFKEYILKRVNHIYSLMFVTLLVVSLEEIIYRSLSGEVFVYQNFDLWHFLLNLCLIQDGWLCNESSFNGPSWCISVELFCYIIFYFILKKRKERYLYVITIFLGAAIFILEWNYPILNQTMARGVICYFIGCILYELYSKKMHINCRVVNIMCLLILVSSIVITKILKSYNWFGNFWMVFMFLLAPIIIWVSINIRWIRKFLELNFFVGIGKCSLSIYLWHFPVQYGIKIVDTVCHLEINYLSKTFFWSYVLIVMIVSLVSFFLIERNKFDIRKIVMQV